MRKGNLYNYVSKMEKTIEFIEISGFSSARVFNKYLAKRFDSNGKNWEGNIGINIV